jgi:hypothetical protein
MIIKKTHFILCTLQISKMDLVWLLNYMQFNNFKILVEVTHGPMVSNAANQWNWFGFRGSGIEVLDLKN